MMTGEPALNVIVICSICEKKSPFDGCDAPGCTWRAEAVAQAIRDGALMNVVCDGSNNSAEDIALGRINIKISAYRNTDGTA
jgi:hypothetical protein